VLQSLRLATDFLAPGGSFITKIFRSKDYNSLLWVFNQLFTKVEATKPPASRNVSAEIFVVCLGYKAPKKMDPRFLDPKAVFAELPAAAPNNEAKVFNPEVKKRKREGYEDGDYLQFHEAPASEFIQTTDPIQMLGSLNKLNLDQQPNGDIALATLNRLPETTEEIRNCCKDLKVLGRKDFKLLLRWRLKVREIFGFSSKKKQAEADAAKAAVEVAEVENMDEELKMQEDLQRIKDQSDSKKKKEKRKDNERKRKEIVRMQMNMTTPMEIGTEQAGPYGEDAMFALKSVDKSDSRGSIVNGRMHSIVSKEAEEETSEEEETDDEGDGLEAELDMMYSHFQEKRAETDAKYKAKKARKEHNDLFEDFSDRESVSDEDDVVQDEESDDESDDEAEETKPLFYESQKGGQGASGLSQRASMFFDQDIFKGIDGLDGVLHADSGVEDMGESSSADDTKAGKSAKKTTKHSETKPTLDGGDENDTDIIEVVRAPSPDPWADDATAEPMTKDGRPDIDIITAEAMTLAHDLASGRISKATLLDDNFNKYSLRDVDGLPEWFLDDEGRHSRLQRPVTAAAAAAIKEKLRALNARPIKKVREAKQRKIFKAAQKLEKLKKKSAMLVEDEGLSEKDKARSIEKMMARAAKKKPQQKVTLVVARGGNRGISGRPKGTKGKYKMVDARLKKDLRGLKRAAKRNKK